MPQSQTPPESAPVLWQLSYHETCLLYDRECTKLTALLLVQDAHAIAHTYCQRMAEIKKTDLLLHPDQIQADQHADAHLVIVRQVATLKKELDHIKAYMDYLQMGGEDNNPFWEDDVRLGEAIAGMLT